MRKAFTLIELLIVIAIIGILTGIAGVSYKTITLRGRDAERINDLNQLAIALSSYYNAQVPAQYVPSAVSVVANGNNTQIAINGTTDLLSTALQTTFINTIPTDPTGKYSYQYFSISTNSLQKGFQLMATLENTNNTKGWVNGAWAVNGYVVKNQ